MKRTCLSVLLLMSAVLVMSCGEQPGEPVTILVPTGPGAQRTPTIDLDTLDYGSISGTLAAGQSGAMYGYMPGWPAKALFGLVVPQSSMPTGESITFTLSVPTYASYLENSPELDDWLIIRLAPTPQQFLGPITVVGTWMTWAGAPPDPLEFYYDGTSVGDVTVTQVGSRYRVTFDVDHFSDWEVGPAEPPRARTVTSKEAQ